MVLKDGGSGGSKDHEQSGCPQDLKKAKGSPLYLFIFGPSVDDDPCV